MGFGPLQLKPDEFWRLTPGEFQDLLYGWMWRERQLTDHLAWHAYSCMRATGNMKDTFGIEDLLGRELGEHHIAFRKVAKSTSPIVTSKKQEKTGAEIRKEMSTIRERLAKKKNKSKKERLASYGELAALGDK